MLLCVSFLQFNGVKAIANPQILSATPIDYWGNNIDVVYRGVQTSLVLVLYSQVSGTYQVYVTLIDVNNVPVAFATTGNIQLNGNIVLTLKLQVSFSAFVGVGKYYIVVTDQNYQSASSLDKPIYIGILGDLNLDGKVNFQDLVSFISAYNYYNQYYAIPSNYRCYDFNGDGKIDFMDLIIFGAAWVSYWYN
jgi:hypothetical protein